MQQVIKTIKILVLTAVFGLMLSAAPASAASSVESSKAAICKGAGLTGANCGDKGAGVNNIISTILNLLSTVAGVAAIIMVIVAGLRYSTSGGDSNKIAGAKSALMYALIGLAVVALSQVLVQFVFQTATGATTPPSP